MFHIRNLSERALRGCRLLSSSQAKPLVGITVDNEGIATVELQRTPVNSLNPELLQALLDSISEVEERKCKGMILTSALPTIFSAGLDLMELHKADVNRLTQMNENILDVVAKLFGTDIITTVAINGYAGAGGCILALTCEYRAMTTGKATIGLNDTAVGIPPAKWVLDLMTRVMGLRQAEYALTSSFMYSAERALQSGLIDDVAADKMDAISKCKAFIKTYDHVSPVVRATTKRAMRQEFLTDLEKNRKQYTKNSLDLLASPVLQNALDEHIQSLKRKKAAKL